MKYVVLFGFVLILASLGSALFYMLKNTGKDIVEQKKMARALGFRVGFSIALFVLILLAHYLGWIQPTGL